MAFDWDKRLMNAESRDMLGAWASDLLLNKHQCGVAKRRDRDRHLIQLRNSPCTQGRLVDSQVGYQLISPKEAEEPSEVSQRAHFGL